MSGISDGLRKILGNNLQRFYTGIDQISEYILIAMNSIAEEIVANRKKIDGLIKQIEKMEESILAIAENNADEAAKNQKKIDELEQANNDLKAGLDCLQRRFDDKFPY